MPDHRLYEAYARRLWLDVSRLTGADSAIVADLVQETFLAAAKSAGGFEPRRDTLWNWLWGNHPPNEFRSSFPGGALH